MPRVVPKWRLIAACTSFALVVTACGGTNVSPSGSQAGSPNGEKTELRIAYSADPKSFNGINDFWTMTSEMNVQMFNRLLTYDHDYNLIGDLAKTWDQSADGKTITFHLKDGVKWQDGQPFTSADVKFHFEKLVEVGKGTTAKKFKASLESITTPDDLTVQFKFSTVFSPHVFARLEADTFILPKHLFDKGAFATNPANLQPVGTGPYKFVSYDQGNSVVMEANPNYFGGKPAIDRLVFQIIPDKNAALLALRAGNIDVIQESLGVPTAEIAGLRDDPNLGVDSYPYYTVIRAQFNSREEAIQKHPWLADKRVREALAMALDRDYLVNTVLNGITTTTNTAISNTIGWVYNKDVQFPKYDKKAAEALLDAAGWPRKGDGTRFSFEMITPLYFDADKVAEAMVQMWKEIGVEMIPVQVDINTYVSQYYANEKGLGDKAAIFGSGGTGPDPNEIRILYHSQLTPDKGGLNATWYNNPDVDKLLDAASNTSDQSAQEGYLKDAQQLIADDLWSMPLYNNFQTKAWSKKFTGFENHRPLAWYVSYAVIRPAE